MIIDADDNDAQRFIGLRDSAQHCLLDKIMARHAMMPPQFSRRMRLDDATAWKKIPAGRRR